MANEITRKELRKQNVRLAVGVYVRTILAALLSVLVYFSVSLIFESLGTEDIGYEIYQQDSSGSMVLISQVYYSDVSESSTTDTQTTTSSETTSTSASQTVSTETTGSQTSGSETSASAGSTTLTETTETTGTTAKIQTISIRSKLSPGAAFVEKLLCQLMMLALLISFPYSCLWERGDKDRNHVDFHHMEYDRWRGLRVGMMAAVPSLIVFVLLVCWKLGLLKQWYLIIYRWLNFCFLPYLDTIFGNFTVKAADASWLLLFGCFAIVAIIPLVSHIAYQLGYRHISISEKFIYKNSNKKHKSHRF